MREVGVVNPACLTLVLSREREQGTGEAASRRPRASPRNIKQNQLFICIYT